MISRIGLVLGLLAVLTGSLRAQDIYLDFGPPGSPPPSSSFGASLGVPGVWNQLSAARREFQEETGFESQRPFLELGSAKNKSGKTIHAWAFEGDCDPTQIHSNEFEMEWPPKSGRRQRFPEVDRAAFFSMDAARVKANPAELVLVERLEQMLRERGDIGAQD